MAAPPRDAVWRSLRALGSSEAVSTTHSSSTRSNGVTETGSCIGRLCTQWCSALRAGASMTFSDDALETRFRATFLEDRWGNRSEARGARARARPRFPV